MAKTSKISRKEQDLQILSNFPISLAFIGFQSALDWLWCEADINTLALVGSVGFKHPAAAANQQQDPCNASSPLPKMTTPATTTTTTAEFPAPYSPSGLKLPKSESSASVPSYLSVSPSTASSLRPERWYLAAQLA